MFLPLAFIGYRVVLGHECAGLLLVHHRRIEQDNRMDNEASQTTGTEATHALGAKGERALNQRHDSNAQNRMIGAVFWNMDGLKEGIKKTTQYGYKMG